MSRKLLPDGSRNEAGSTVGRSACGIVVLDGGQVTAELPLPVAGLLALAGQSLRQSEFAHLEKLAALPPDRLSALMVSTDRFMSAEADDLPSPRERTNLIHRLGLLSYGAKHSRIGNFPDMLGSEPAAPESSSA